MLILGFLVLLMNLHCSIAAFQHKCGLIVPYPLFSLGKTYPPTIEIRTSNEIKTPFSLLVYRESDRALTNIPSQSETVESWGSGFGLCLQEDVESKKCDQIGQFKLDFKDDDVESRIINTLFTPAENLRPVSLKVYDHSRYCYLFSIDDDVLDRAEGKIETLLLITHQSLLVTKATSTIILYYGRLLLVLSQIVLAAFIWLKKLKTNTIRELGSKRYNPYQYFFNMLIIASICNLPDVWFFQQRIEGILSLSTSSHNDTHSLISAKLDILQEVFVYLIIYQFINLDKPGFKINFRRGRYGLFFVGAFIWSSIIHRIVVPYRYKILTLLKIVNKDSRMRRPSIFYGFADYFFKVLDFLTFATLWYVLYKKSHESENELANHVSYTRKFKLTRVFIIASAILMKVFAFISDRFFFPVTLNLTKYIHGLFSNGFNPTESIISWFLFLILKLLLCVLKNFDIFALPLLIALASNIWWSYDAYKDDNGSIRLEEVSERNSYYVES